MMHKAGAAALIVFLAGTAGCVKEKAAISGEVKLVVGEARRIRDGHTKILAVRDDIREGDIIVTGDKSTVIASLGDGFADMEIQPDSMLQFSGLVEGKRELEIKSGNLWLRVNKKLLRGDEFTVKSKTTVAAVRGTKFYTFQAGDITGTCFCRGSVDFGVKGAESRVHQQDYLVLIRGGRKITLTPDDLRFMLKGKDPHRHSVLDNSPLGPPRSDITAEMQKRFDELVAKKFRELEK